MLQQLALPAAAPLSLLALVGNLLIATALALVLRMHYTRYASTLTNRAGFAQIFPFIVLTTVLIISVVKSSLALSLGLVGALSIVRFRTPIKEPEELAYLFLAIAIGLGLGADHRLNTCVATAVILGVIAAIQAAKTGATKQNLYLSVSLSASNEPDKDLARLGDAIAKRAEDAELRRFDVRGQSLEATYFIDVESADGMTELVADLRAAFAGIEITFIDQHRVPGL